MNALRSTVKSLLVRRQHARNESRRVTLGQQDGTLSPELWDLSVDAEGHLVVQGHDVVDLARTYGTPLHVVSRARLAKDFNAFRDAFRAGWPRTEVGYSYKTNPLPGVLRELHAMGAWAEAISEFELWLALKLGVPPERIIFNGPGKSEDGIRLAVSHGVRLINIDSLDEVARVARIAAAAQRRQTVGVRVVTSVGWSGQFGHNLANGEAYEAFRRLASLPSTDPCGMHVHLGTGLHNVSQYLQAIREMLEFARRLDRELGVAIRFLDFGGGFGVPTVRPLDTWDTRLLTLGYPPGPIELASVPRIGDFASAIVALLREYYPADVPTAPTILFEPGRAITSSAQMLVLRVLTVKPAAPGGARRVILDGGKNIALPTGYEIHEMFPASRMHAAPKSFHHFYGPLCHPGDVLLRWKRFAEVDAGDVVALMDAGAYFIPNQMNFSNPRPAAILLDVDDVRVIRTRESFEDIVRLDGIEATIAGQARAG